MRKKVSDRVALFNGLDGEWETEITQMEKKECGVTVLEQKRKQAGTPDLWLVFAPIKHGNIDFLAEKATELGVSALVPVFTQNTVASRVNIERLKANAIEAAEQSERLTIPEVHEPKKLQEIIANWPKDRKIMLCDESGGGESIAEAIKNEKKDDKWAILIGPEGGFSKDELVMLHKLPYLIAVGLGPRILKADTAAIAAISCWQQHLGDWDKRPRFET